MKKSLNIKKNKIIGYPAVLNGEEVAVAITQTGVVLAVVPSTPEQAEFKLGMRGPDNKNCHDKYNTFFKNEEWETVFVDKFSIEGHLPLQRAFKKANKKQDDLFETTRQKLMSKNPNQKERKMQRFGAKVVEVEDE